MPDAYPLNALLDREIGSLDGVVLCVLSTNDGMFKAHTTPLDQTLAAQVAAMGTTWRGAAKALSSVVSGGEVRQVVMETDTGMFLAVEAAENTLLIAQTTPDADIATIVHVMIRLATQVSADMAAAQRVSEESRG